MCILCILCGKVSSWALLPAGFWELLGLVGECEAGKRPGRGAGRTLGDFPLAAR